MTKTRQSVTKNSSNKQFFHILLSLLIVALGLTCTESGANNYFGNNTNQAVINATLDDQAVLAAQAQHAIKLEVTVVAKVKKLLAEDVQGLPHQRFLIELSNGSTVLIAHDLKMAPVVPIKPGDVVCIHGEYIWNKLGGLIHWTHHSDTPRHEDGWIDFNGLRYQ